LRACTAITSRAALRSGERWRARHALSRAPILPPRRRSERERRRRGRPPVDGGERAVDSVERERAAWLTRRPLTSLAILRARRSWRVQAVWRCWSPARDLGCKGVAPMTPAALRCRTRRHHSSQHSSPRSPSRPSFTSHGTMSNAATGSAHHQPAAAFATKPSSSVRDR